MDMIIIGIDHVDHAGLEKLITEIVELEKIVLIGEENAFDLPTVARKVALHSGISWVQIDMNTEQRIEASIYEKLSNRMQIRGYDEHCMPIQAKRYAPREDGIREEFWLDRLEEMKADGAVLVVCGGLHPKPLSEKAQRRGHRIKRLVFHPGRLSRLQPELF
jgi:hypothetical protein